MAKKKTNKQPWSSSLESREALYKGVNPSAGFDPLSIATQTVGYLGGFRTGKGMPEDEARWAAYLGLPYDKTYAPDTKIRFEGDENYPDRQYQGLSKRAKDEVRKKIIPQAKRIKDKYNKEWIQVLDTKPNSEYNYTNIYHNRQNYLGDLGKFGIREVGESGIYEVGDKYDFPALIPIPDRNEGTELMVRDTIWSDRANPKLYNQEVIKRKNKHDIGGFLSNIGSKLDGWNTNLTDKFLDSGIGKGLSGFGIKAGGLGGIANTAATAIGGLAAGGRSSAVGNAMQKVGSLASNIPGVGGLIGAGVNLLGGVVNGAFGSKLNAENIAAVEGDIKQALNFNSNAGDYDALASNYAGLQGVRGFNKGFIGKDGWWGGSKAKDKFNSLKTQAEEAEAHQLLALADNAQNIADTNLQLLEANYSAYGGPIDMKYTGVMSPFGNQFKDGGIYIRPSKRGTFTAAAKKRGMGVQEFASKVLANKEDYSPAMVKKANFARNASKWKHNDGGPLEDSEYYSIMERVAKDNYKEWGFKNADEALAHALNDNTYNYRGYYSKYPKSKANADTHWTDEFKTVYHPTFSNESVYSGKVSQYNPEGLIGGSWDEETFIPADWQNKKADGGNLFTNGVTTIGNGGTHEQNPYEGVQMGVDPQGIPNLVEEGEVIYNDYVFSNRLRVPKAIRQKYKLRGTTFADAAKQLQKESEERPNDSISKKGLEANMQMLMNEQEMIRAKKENNKFARGGRLCNKFLLGGEPDIDNPYSPYRNNNDDYSRWFTLDPNNTSKVTSYSDDYKDFIFTKELAKLYALRNPNDESLKSFLDRGNKIEDLTDEDVQKGSLDTNFGWLHKARAEAIKSFNEVNKHNIIIPPIENKDIINDLDRLTGTPILNRNNTKVKDLPIVIEDEVVDENHLSTAGRQVAPMKDNWLRKFPIWMSGVAVANDLFGGNEPDYSNANMFERAIEGTNRPIRSRQIGNYLTYRPFDRDFYINKLNADASATRRGVMNTSGGNRAAAMAGLLAADYNYGNQLGALARQAEEYNLAQRQKVEEFNRGTNMTNAEMGLKADMANAEQTMQRAKMYGSLAEYRDKILAANRAEKSANLTNFIQSVGGLGRELADRDMLRWLAELGVLKYDASGKYTGDKKSNGGRINRKKRGGFTI